MNKKLAIGILSLAIMTTGATAAFGAIDTTKLGEIKELYGHAFSIQKQIIDKEEEAGIITSTQATTFKNSIDQRSTLTDQAIDNGQVPGIGAGIGYGRGFGMGMFNNGQPPTQDQIEAMLKIREENLKLYEEAVKNGTITPGQGFGPGIGQGYGPRGGR